MASILLVDPDPSVCLFVRGSLEENGHEVVVVDNGESALQVLRDGRPRVVITEVMIPKLDGLALCRNVKSDGAAANVRVIVMSILAASSRSRDAGADAFIKKPVTRARLLEAVQDVLETIS